MLPMVGIALGGAGEVVEYGVKMARMPEDRMMTAIIQAGGLTREHLDAIITTLVPFYQAAEAGEVNSRIRPFRGSVDKCAGKF